MSHSQIDFDRDSRNLKKEMRDLEVILKESQSQLLPLIARSQDYIGDNHEHRIKINEMIGRSGIKSGNKEIIFAIATAA